MTKNQYYTMVKQALDLDLAASEYEEKFCSYFSQAGNQAPCLDLVLLGIGEDGHIASLFPQDEVLSENKRWVVPVRQEHRGAKSITLTYPTMNRAKKIFFLVTGENKSDILRRVLEGDQTLPASFIDLQKGNCVLFCDKAATSLMTQKQLEFLSVYHIDEETK